MTCTALTERTERPDEETVTDELSGHLCRCTGYQNIRAAVRQALDESFGPQEAQ